MAFNDVRRPILEVSANGQPVRGVFDVHVESSQFYAADRYTLRSSLSADLPTTWSGVPLLIEIGIGLDGDVGSLLLGKADSITIDPLRGEIRATGRDLASVFIDTQLDQSFENQTASDIAFLLAGRRGLDADIVPTTHLVGRYYQTGHTRTTLTQHARATTEWELLTWLAQMEDYDIWVTGRTLHFRPVAQATAAFTISPADCMSMQLHHALDIAEKATVTVKSWNSAGQTVISRSATNATGSASGTTRTIVRPNLSSDDAQDLAGRVLAQISAHERVVTFEMPGDLTTSPRAIVAVADTGTDFDGLYTISSIDRQLSFHNGFIQSVEARSLPWMPF